MLKAAEAEGESDHALREVGDAIAARLLMRILAPVPPMAVRSTPFVNTAGTRNARQQQQKAVKYWIGLVLAPFRGSFFQLILILPRVWSKQCTSLFRLLQAIQERYGSRGPRHT
jgi:hypothetical protein